MSRTCDLRGEPRPLRVAKVRDTAIIPTRKNPTDAGIDFYSDEDSFILKPFEMILVRTGISVEVPKGWMLLLKPKGRSNHLVGAGVVDAGYEPGEIVVKLFNPTKFNIPIPRGSAIAQGVLVSVSTREIVETTLDVLGDKELGRSGSGKILEQVSMPFKSNLEIE